MKQFIQLTLPTGHVYEIPVALIALHRAKAMHELHKDEFPTLDAALEDTKGLFADDDYSIKDWAQNQMNWPEIEQGARIIRFTPKETPWHEGEWSFHQAPAMIGELDGESIMKTPVEVVASMMAASKQLCNITVLNDQDGQPFGAIAMIVGNPATIKAYLTTMQFTAEQIGGAAQEPTITH